MKKLIKHIMTVEGKKHQASVGDLREILKILCQTIVEQDSVEMAKEFVNYLEKMATKKHKRKTAVVIDIFDVGPIKKKAKKCIK